ERMRKIADMGTRALDDFLVGVDQRIGFARQRFDLHWKDAGESFSGSGSDSGKAVSNALEWRKTEFHLKHGGEQQYDREAGKSNDQRLIELARLVGNLGGVARDRDEIMPFIAEIDIAFDQPQMLVFRAFNVTFTRAIRARGDAKVLQMRQSAIPQRARRTDVTLVGIGTRHLPVPARQRQFEQRLADGLREFVVGVLRRGNVGNERAQVNIETAVEGALDRLPV